MEEKKKIKQFTPHRTVLSQQDMSPVLYAAINLLEPLSAILSTQYSL